MTDESGSGEEVASAPLAVEHVGQLAELASLADMIFYRVSGERLELVQDSSNEAVADVKAEDDVPLQVLLRHDEKHIEVRLRVEATSPEARYVVDVGARFDLEVPVHAPREVLQEFVERVGVMAAYPFAREALHSIASKMGLQTPLLQLLKANQIQLTPNDPVDE